MNTKALSLDHIIRPSSITGKKPPVLFMLHGYGSNEDDLFSFASELPEIYFIISVRAPFSLSGYGFAWYSIHFDAEEGKWSDDVQAIESRDKMKSFIAEACQAYELDATDVTLLGFSQGSILSYAIALSYPEIVTRVIALSGYINMNLLADNFKSNDFSGLHIYASHGSSDQVIPVDWPRKTIPLLGELSIDYVYEEYPVGHGVLPQNFLSFRNWLLKKSNLF